MKTIGLQNGMRRGLHLILVGCALFLASGCGSESGSTVRDLIVTPTEPAPDGMKWIAGGAFMMGEAEGHLDEQPVHRVEVDGFWMDSTEVTNREFARFVEATAYLTVAERPLDPSDFPGADPTLLVPGSLVFRAPDHRVRLDDFTQWWAWTPGANWRRPQGPDSSIEGLEDHPVVHVAWDDAAAYAEWIGKRLPTEAEWEYAARAGAEGSRFVWGDEPPSQTTPPANIWQGRFPDLNTETDGFATTAPVASFPPNPWGLFDMAGNVWEWTADWYDARYYEKSPTRNPPGPEFEAASRDTPMRSLRGGSFLCHDTYCERYRPAAREKNTPDTGTDHQGFRLVRS